MRLKQETYISCKERSIVFRLSSLSCFSLTFKFLDICSSIWNWPAIGVFNNNIGRPHICEWILCATRTRWWYANNYWFSCAIKPNCYNVFKIRTKKITLRTEKTLKVKYKYTRVKVHERNEITAGREVKNVISFPKEVRATALSLYLPSCLARVFNWFIWGCNNPFCPTTEAPLRTLDTVTLPRSTNMGSDSSLNACHNRNCNQPS